ncbi:MAG: 5'-methylthioadenosine/S-adenosylhomocysteine nucleosidase, partial [Lachnospiraceae bacterium]|nr:5'-methylthioadenosine/S-adenosylhomocysteine nucleosidase [Lachnospiraceae bacterium]
MRIGIIGAMQIEVDNLKKHLTDTTEEVVSGVTFTSGRVDGVEVVAAVSGVGKVFAAICAEAMILTYKVDCVINIGVAGTLCDELGVMDVAIADKVVQHDMNTSALGDPVGLLSGLNEVFLPADQRLVQGIEKVVEAKGIHHKVGTIA